MRVQPKIFYKQKISTPTENQWPHKKCVEIYEDGILIYIASGSDDRTYYRMYFWKLIDDISFGPNEQLGHLMKISGKHFCFIPEDHPSLFGDENTTYVGIPNNDILKEVANAICTAALYHAEKNQKDTDEESADLPDENKPLKGLRRAKKEPSLASDLNRFRETVEELNERYKRANQIMNQQANLLKDALHSFETPVIVDTLYVGDIIFIDKTGRIYLKRGMQNVPIDGTGTMLAEKYESSRLKKTFTSYHAILDYRNQSFLLKRLVGESESNTLAFVVERIRNNFIADSSSSRTG